MNIYLAGDNGKKRIISELIRGGYNALMHIYLAGGVTGNLNKFWKDLSLEKGLTVDKIREKMNIYLVNASTTARKDRVGAVAENIRNLLNTTDDNLMKLYMAGTEPRKNYLFEFLRGYGESCTAFSYKYIGKLLLSTKEYRIYEPRTSFR